MIVAKGETKITGNFNWRKDLNKCSNHRRVNVSIHRINDDPSVVSHGIFLGEKLGVYGFPLKDIKHRTFYTRCCIVWFVTVSIQRERYNRWLFLEDRALESS